MKLTAAVALAVTLCLISLAARSSAIRDNALRAAAEARAADLARHPGDFAVALAVDSHLRARLQHLAAR